MSARKELVWPGPQIADLTWTDLGKPGKINRMNLNLRLLQQVKPAWLRLGLAILAGFLAGLATIWQAGQISRVVTGAFLERAGLSASLPALGWLLAAVVLRAGLTFASEWAASAAAIEVKDRLRETILRHVMRLGPAYLEGEQSGDLANTLIQGIEALDAYFSQYLPQLALAGLLPVAYLALIFPRDPLSGLVLLLTGPLIPVFMFLIGSMAQALTRRQWQALGKMSAYFLDTLQGLATLKMLGRSQEQGQRIADVSERYRLVTMQVLRVTFLSALVLELLSTIGTAIVAVEIGLRLLYGRVGFETAFFLLLLAPDFYFPLRALGLRFHASMAGMAAARSLLALLDQPAPEVQVGRSPAVQLPALSARPFTIAFEQVCYAYPDRSYPAVENVSFTLHSGQLTALVGPSGAGKSTIARLLLGFASPQAGQITLDGQLLAALPQDEWRARLAWVPQRPALFRDSLAANLRLARPAASLDDLRQAARLASLDAWIDSLPDGYDTLIGEGGARLSGGQAQRLALARAFLRDAPILILDEPTASLDVELEAQLQAALERLCRQRTVLVIAHRLATAARAEQVLVMAGGRLVQAGAHAELAQQDGLYARLLAAARAGFGGQDNLPQTQTGMSAR